jgi:AraC-like DNA-binding protein
MKINIFSPISLSDIAKHCGVSNSSLKNLFKAHTHLGVMHYYNELKMEKAKEMLFEGISISAIAEELRFSSSAHFSAAFKKYTGLSPLKYKKQAPHS